MDKYNIDVCLTGHDHSYCRTYQIIDGRAVDYGKDEAVDPQGTLYITAGSSTGSKYYELNYLKQYYVAERNAEHTPSFSIVNFSDDAFSIQTYTNEGGKYAGDFTIKKTTDTKSADRASLQKLVQKDKAENIQKGSYTDASYSRYSAALKAASDYLGDAEGEDGGAALITKGYDKSFWMGDYPTTDNNPADVLDLGANVWQSEYLTDEKTPDGEAKEVFKKGISAFQDKTRDESQGVKSAADFQKLYDELVAAKAGLTKVSFTDISRTDYFYQDVLWAAENKITVGTTATTFSPRANVSRAQVVSFLYRAFAGGEKAEQSKFKDVPAKAYFADPVAWAVKKNITAGTTATTFAPYAPCTRAQVVSFLYRTLGKGEKVSNSQFTDVPAGAYYKDAVAWAVKKGITVGRTATTFAPNATCTRAEAVAFLHRAAQVK